MNSILLQLTPEKTPPLADHTLFIFGVLAGIFIGFLLFSKQEYARCADCETGLRPDTDYCPNCGSTDKNIVESTPAKITAHNYSTDVRHEDDRDDETSDDAEESSSKSIEEDLMEDVEPEPEKADSGSSAEIKPLPVVIIDQLEQQNERLQEENKRLRRKLDDRGERGDDR